MRPLADVPGLESKAVVTFPPCFWQVEEAFTVALLENQTEDDFLLSPVKPHFSAWGTRVRDG